MRARKIECRLISKEWLTPSVLGIKFEPAKKFTHEPGQFLSLVIPPGPQDPKPLKRAYSLSSAPNAKVHELCVKFMPGGHGSEYLNFLKPGDSFTVFAPYGDFSYRPNSERSICMIATGSGIAPFRSIVLSEAFQEHCPPKATLLFGCRGENEIIYRGEFEARGVEVVNALTNPKPEWKGFRGRVTDYLRTLPNHWGWHTTDFYICGNAAMVLETESILRNGHGVPESAIHREVFLSKRAPEGEAPEREPAKVAEKDKKRHLKVA